LGDTVFISSIHTTRKISISRPPIIACVALVGIGVGLSMINMSARVATPVARKVGLISSIE
jgi:xanthosine utilization system XapX-like protein